MKQKQNSTLPLDAENISGENKSPNVIELLKQMGEEIKLMREQMKEFERSNREEIESLRSLLKKHNIDV